MGVGKRGLFVFKLPTYAQIDQSAVYLHRNGQESKEASVIHSARCPANYQMEALCNSRGDLDTINRNCL